MNGSDLAQVLVTGIAAGSIYTLMGMGLVHHLSHHQGPELRAG